MTTSAAVHPDYIAGTWTLDPTHSEISFSVRHLKITKVKGVFEDFDVTVVTSEADPYASTVEANIRVASVNTKVEARDQHLRTSDFFLADEHPVATFRGTTVTGDAETGEFTLEGELTLRGVTKPVTLTGEYGGVATDGYGNTKAGVSATTVINRHDFGVSWNAALEAGGMTLGDDVTISIDLQLVLAK